MFSFIKVSDEYVANQGSLFLSDAFKVYQLRVTTSSNFAAITEPSEKQLQ